MCKIISNKAIGSGFFIKLYKEEEELFCLMSNEHIITKEMIERKEIIDVYYKFEKKRLKIKLDDNERYIREFTDLDID